MTQTLAERLEDRQNAIMRWLAENAPECGQEQAHLDAGSAERTYWHHGYAMAMRDVLALLRGDASTLKH